MMRMQCESIMNIYQINDFPIKKTHVYMEVLVLFDIDLVLVRNLDIELPHNVLRSTPCSYQQKLS